MSRDKALIIPFYDVKILAMDHFERAVI